MPFKTWHKWYSWIYKATVALYQSKSQHKTRNGKIEFWFGRSDHSFPDVEWQQQGFWKNLAFWGKQTSVVQEHVISGHILALHFLSHEQHDQPRGTLVRSNIIRSLGMCLRFFKSSTAWQVILPSLSPFFALFLLFISDLGSQCHLFPHIACEQHNQRFWPGMKICWKEARLFL